MSLGVSDGPVTVYQGDALDELRAMPDESVNCCVTSPPYWGLRDYGTTTWDGGDRECDHIGPPMRTNNKASNASATFHGGTYRANEPWRGGICGKCGAKRVDSQLGLEDTPEQYVANLVEVFREVKRVMRKDATLWLNLGDSYAGSWGAQGHRESPATISRNQIASHPKRASHTGTIRSVGLKPKDLIGIPWRVALALQADGWWLRSDIIWSKADPMPESVTDRPTKAHEYVFLLTKSPRYYYDAAAIREPNLHPDRSGSNPRLAISTQPGNTFQSRPGRMAIDSNPLGRNKRDVWTIATQAYSGAHFATFPEDLVVPCILAGSREGDVVLDPFAGSGTTLAVARRLGRRSIGIELNPEYVELIRERVAGSALPLLEALS